jgi:large subunit ribosomal protein L21
VEWWVWLLLIVVVVLVLLAIWWWWRQAQERQSSTPRMAFAAPPPPLPLPEERLAALPAPAVPEADDLAAIEGVGPRIHDILNEAGIKTFAQLADTPVARISEILVAAELHVPANPSTWPAQARLAADSKWQELKELQDSLKGGK